MTMPEATVHKDCPTPAGEDNVRLAGQRLGMQPIIAQAQSPKDTPYRQFGCRILPTDATHVSVSLRRCENVNHAL